MKTEISQINQASIEHELCGCPGCDQGVQLGHFACSVPEEDMLGLERAGRIIRAYDDGRWRWIAV